MTVVVVLLMWFVVGLPPAAVGQLCSRPASARFMHIIALSGDRLGRDVYVHVHRYILELLKKDLKPRDIMTYKAFENAIVTVMATGGSTNAVLHYLAIARAVGVPLSLDDFQRISDRVSAATGLVSL